MTETANMSAAGLSGEITRRPDQHGTLDSAGCKIMVVDDLPLNVKLVCAHLSQVGYCQFVKIDDSTQALAALYVEDPDLLLLDLMMPHVSGIDILRAVREDQRSTHLPVLILTATEDRALKSEALEAGATDFLSKPIDSEDLILRVRNALIVKRYQDTLERQVRERTLDLQQSRQEVVHCLARAAEYRDNDTGNHVIRVGQYVAIIARELGLDDVLVQRLEQAATLHDVGKIGISDSILLKPGKLTEAEFDLMKKHCGFGHSICHPVTAEQAKSFSSHTTLADSILGHSGSPLLQMARTIALTHHEKWDGSGYPRGLKGEDIPLEGRITAVADVFDALSTKRPYKVAYPLDKCLAILDEDRGSHFDPRIVDAFFARREQAFAIHGLYGDVDVPAAT